MKKSHQCFNRPFRFRTSLDVDMMSVSMIDTGSSLLGAAAAAEASSAMCQSYHPSVHATSTPLKGMGEGGTASPMSLPAFPGKSKFRPLSAPPGRLECNRFLREGSPFKQVNCMLEMRRFICDKKEICSCSSLSKKSS